MPPTRIILQFWTHYPQDVTYPGLATSLLKQWSGSSEICIITSCLFCTPCPSQLLPVIASGYDLACRKAYVMQESTMDFLKDVVAAAPDLQQGDAPEEQETVKRRR